MNSHDNTTPDSLSLIPDYWDYRLERNNFWYSLRLFRKDVIDTDPESGNVEKLRQILLENYGVSIHLTDQGQILPSYEVVDESKYTMFLLKYDR